MIHRIRPTPTDAYLANPHKGCCTFQRFNGDPLFPGTTWSEEGPLLFPPAAQAVAPGYLPATVAYCRWFWRDLEPRRGEYDFSMIEGALRTCAERGQTLAVRLMPFGSSRQPQLPAWYLRDEATTERAHGDATLRVPLYDSPPYLELWGGVIREFGRRYDGHPALESMDIAYIGPWGEGDGECSVEQCERFAQLWRDALPRTPRLALIAGDQLRAGLESGAGWRCDCFGDVGCWSEASAPDELCWNHMYEYYPSALVAAGARDSWKSAPVHLETCWVPMHWFQKGFDLDFILQQGLKYHATYFMPKSTALPPEWMEQISQFCRRLGYRFVFRTAVWDDEMVDNSFCFRTWIENVGVAPIYHRYDFALRFRQNQHEVIVAFDDVDIRAWLPGDVWLDRAVALPAGFQRGSVELSAGLVDESRQARVSFAVEETEPDRWLPLGEIELQAAG
jgi:hypothetical protein